MGEFSANANVSATTKVPLFLVTKSYNPRMSFDSTDLSADLTRKKIANSMAKLIANRIEEVWDFMKKENDKIANQTGDSNKLPSKRTTSV